MRILTVDDYAQRAKNRPMNLRDVGNRVRARRTEQRMTQMQLAEKARVGLGTVQALEDAVNRKRPRQTSPENLQKIAKALDWQLDDLLTDNKMIEPSNPLLKGLNDEHLEVAQWYMKARKKTRAHIDALMAHGEDDRITSLMTRLQNMSPEARRAIEDFIPTAEAVTAVESPTTAPIKKTGSK